LNHVVNLKGFYICDLNWFCVLQEREMVLHSSSAAKPDFGSLVYILR